MYLMIPTGNLMVDHHPDTGSHLIDMEVLLLLPTNAEGNGDMDLATDRHTLCKSVAIAKDRILVPPILVPLIILCRRILILHGAHLPTKDIHSLHPDTILHHRDSLRLARNTRQKR